MDLPSGHNTGQNADCGGLANLLHAATYSLVLYPCFFSNLALLPPTHWRSTQTRLTGTAHIAELLVRSDWPFLRTSR